MDYGGGGHRLHETCGRIVQTEFRAIRRDHRHRHRPQCAAVSSSLVWTSLLYERCSRGVTLLIPTGILHDVPWGSRLLGSHSFDVDFASVKSVSLWQLLRPGPPQTVQRAFGAQRLLPIVHSCHQLTTLLTGPVKHAVRPWACHYPSLAALVVLRASCAPAESHAPTHAIILRRRHPQHPIRLDLYAHMHGPGVLCCRASRCAMLAMASTHARSELYIQSSTALLHYYCAAVAPGGLASSI